MNLEESLKLATEMAVEYAKEHPPSVNDDICTIAFGINHRQIYILFEIRDDGIAVIADMNNRAKTKEVPVASLYSVKIAVTILNLMTLPQEMHIALLNDENGIIVAAVLMATNPDDDFMPPTIH